jgi:hypothetical protein
MVEDA